MVINTHKSVCILSMVSMFLLLSITAFAEKSPIVALKQAGLYGRVHAWDGVTLKSHNINVVVPKNAPVIISDYHSTVGVNGLRRSGRHHGTDIFAETGSPVIAAADGRVIRAKVDRCWGPTLLIRHGLDSRGRPLYALYGHVKNMMVKVGQVVRRGQQVAEMGDDIFTSCGGGVHHLHFQISYNSRKIPFLGWGWANFVSDGMRAPNPHQYWAGGVGKITCFEEGRRYRSSGLTYPVPCYQGSDQKKTGRVGAQKTHEKFISQEILEREAQFQEYLTEKLAKDLLVEEEMESARLNRELTETLKGNI